MEERFRDTYRPDIDGLRALAVLSVVLAHFFPGRLPGGFIGVDVFFVISGYLITGLILKDLQQSVFSFAGFYARRFRRILPSLTIILLAAWTAGFFADELRFVFLADELQALGRHISAGAAFVSNILLWQETGYFDKAAELKPLLHLWSLGIEEQFYLAWPVLLMLWYRKGWPIGKFIIAIALVSFLINVGRMHTHSAEVFYMLPSRFWELLVGCGLAYRESQKESLSPVMLADIKAFGAAGLFFFALFFISGGKSYPGWWAMLPVASALLFISAGPHAWLNRHVLSSRPAVFIGLISYPLYLWHWPMLSFLRIARNGDSGKPLLRIGVMLMAFILSWITYKWVERPIRTRFFTNEWIGDNKRIFLNASLAAVIVIALLGVLTSKGIIFSYKQKNMIQFATAYATYANDIWSDIVRAGKCHLDTADPSDFNPVCYEKNAPVAIALFGDSHATHLYPGLKDYFGKDASIMEFGRGCPPLFRFENNAICEKSGKLVMNVLKNTKPDVLIFSAQWFGYYPSDPLFFRKFNEAVLEAKSLGVKNVVVIGDSPIWHDRLYKIMARDYLSFGRDIPKRALDEVGIDKWPSELDRNFMKLPVHYLSISQKLCNKDGCTVLVGDNIMTDLIVFDNGHFTENGSKYVVNNFIGPFIRHIMADGH